MYTALYFSVPCSRGPGDSLRKTDQRYVGLPCRVDTVLHTDAISLMDGRKIVSDLKQPILPTITYQKFPIHKIVFYSYLTNSKVLFSHISGGTAHTVLITLALLLEVVACRALAVTVVIAPPAQLVAPGSRAPNLTRPG